jgi:hypothetical protein
VLFGHVPVSAYGVTLHLVCSTMDMDESTERELRQFGRMDKLLRSFESSELSLERTLAGLRGLLSALDETPEDWTRHFKAAWNAIEVEYAAALSRGTALPGPSAQGVQEAAEKMLSMVDERISALDRT